jgi:hypothetical protein
MPMLPEERAMDEDDGPPPQRDIVYERVQAVRNIADDLEKMKNKEARELLKKAGELTLQHLALRTAPTVELATNNGKPAKERPL